MEKGIKIIYFICIFSYFQNLNVQSQKLIERFKWKQIEYERLNDYSESTDFVFPGLTNGKGSNSPHQNQQQQSNYIAYNNVPMGVTHYKGKLIITMPRRRPGIPSTLNFVLTSETSTSPKLKAFPNEDVNQINPNNENLVSVYRTSVDECDRLWFVDTGILEYPNNRTQLKQPSIWIINLKNNEKIHRFEIPENVVNDGSGLASITIDTNSDSCDNAYAYLPDLSNYRLYVYSLQQNRIWTFSHNYFSFDPLWGDFHIAGQKFQWNDGIFSITLGKKNPDGFRTAYFHAMCSISEFGVSTKVLQNQTNTLRSYHGNDFKFLGSRGPDKQSNMHEYDPNTGIIMYTEINSGVGCWNTNKLLMPENYATIQKNDLTMIYPSDLSIDSEGVMWLMTNSMPLFIYSSLDPNEYNFRVWTQNVKEATKNTVCQTHTHGYN